MAFRYPSKACARCTVTSSLGRAFRSARRQRTRSRPRRSAVLPSPGGLYRSSAPLSPPALQWPRPRPAVRSALRPRCTATSSLAGRARDPCRNQNVLLHAHVPGGFFRLVPGSAFSRSSSRGCWPDFTDLSATFLFFSLRKAGWREFQKQNHLVRNIVLTDCAMPMLVPSCLVLPSI